MKNCPNCQHELTDAASFCGACGYKIEPAAPVVSPTAAPSAPVVSPTAAPPAPVNHVIATNETKEKAKRPLSITVICVIGFLVGAFSLLTFGFIRTNLALQFGNWYTLYAGIINVVSLMSMVGLWMMKKWAAYTYTGIQAAGVSLTLYSGSWDITNITSLLVSALLIFFVLKHLSKMT